MHVSKNTDPSPNATLRAGYFARRGFVDHTPDAKDFARCCDIARWIVRGTVWSSTAVVQERNFDGNTWRTLFAIED